MKKIGSIFKIAIYIINLLILILIFGTLTYSAITRTPINECLIDYQWWILFLLASIFSESISKKINE